MKYKNEEQLKNELLDWLMVEIKKEGLNENSPYIAVTDKINELLNVKYQEKLKEIREKQDLKGFTRG